jgi:hypothetical protein
MAIQILGHDRLQVVEQADLRASFGVSRVEHGHGRGTSSIAGTNLRLR